ncbi:MAG: DUF2135 domain-containing protein [Planctomycetes bacterium]|nr:DUF2135 domain-containing protein [Planctomycetota bacterium]
MIKNLDVDLRITIGWDTDNTDIDLHIREPSGQLCYYSRDRTHIGGFMSEDFTGGYGPEEYFLRNAMNGKYAISCNYYGSDQQTLTGAATVTATVFLNYGRANETKKRISLQLNDVKEYYMIGEAVILKK